MSENVGDLPDLERLRGVVAPEILEAAAIASAALREAGVRHVLVGGLAVGAHGYPRTTEDVDFLVGDEAFIRHTDGRVTLRVPIVAVGNVRVDVVPLDDSTPAEELRAAIPSGEQVPVVSLPVLVYLKFKANRQKDLADLVELLKRGRIEVDATDRYLQEHAPGQLARWQRVKETAAREE